MCKLNANAVHWLFYNITPSVGKEKQKLLNEDLELTRLKEVEKDITALRDKYLPEPKDKFELEKQRSGIKKSLYNSIIKLNEQINNGERAKAEQKNKFENDNYINKLREIKKEKEDLLELIAPRLLKSPEQKNIERLEKVATKTPIKLSKLSYDQRLAILGLTSLKDRRVRGDLIQMFKIMKGLEVVEWENI